MRYVSANGTSSVFGLVVRLTFLSVLLFVGAGPVRAVEYGEMVQQNGKWVFQSTEDPIFKLMRTKGLITDEEYFKASAQTGKNWIEPADAVLNQRRDIERKRYLKTAMHLPDWVDLGIENRTRFESYDHPWRSTQAIGGGQTDSQMVLRSRVRVGLGAMAPSGFSLKGRIHGPTGTMPQGIL